MSSLFEKCPHCGNRSFGSLFCSDTCRSAALPSTKPNTDHVGDELTEGSARDQPTFLTPASRSGTVEGLPVLEEEEEVFAVELQMSATEFQLEDLKQLEEYRTSFHKGRKTD
jgi:hypothetical protein